MGVFVQSSSLKEKLDRSINDGMDYSGDAAVGSFFSTDYKRHDDLKQMLDSSRDNLKLEAMKRIIGMVAKGRDASDLFPAVVKNVVSKNTEVKKLVYVYLVRYAEEQQDLALLSISTFQRALKDPNQLIRASALRVLSSIRVPVIVPIVMLAIRDSAADMSPYVRKTAAHAIPKLYSLDPDQKDELVTILDKLLADRTTLVVGSAVMAFDEVCPERIDLIHKNYRKLCALLVDVDEWGQVVILNMLTRYARTQFVDPNLGDLSLEEDEDRPFYEDENEHNSEDNEDEHSSDDEENENKEGKGNKKKSNDKQKSKEGNSHQSKKLQMDPDHRLLLKNSRPLLQSRNASVVMAVAQMYHHVAPKSEVHVVIKALIRLLRSHVEVQAVVLTCIAAMSTNRKSLFEPYMKSFFVRSSDPTQIKLLKLEILTNIANETNIPPILREFQTYISSQDKEFVAAAIQAIGRCASNIKEVAETCLNGLVSLLSHRDPAVVGGAVVVAKTLLQTQRSGNKSVIAQLAKMVDRVTVAPARAAILWLLGEHCERIPNLPPDVLRKMAKTFPDEDDIVKLQIINLAAKLQLTNPSQTTLLCQYVLNMAKYDQSYDIRDRARFIRHLLFPEKPNSKLSKYAKKILLSSKPAPILQSKFKDRDHYQLGSLSHFLNTRAVGYQDLPTFPVEPPDSSVRNVEPPKEEIYTETSAFAIDALNSKKGSKGKKKQSKKRSFYSDDDASGSEKSEGSGSESGSSSSSSGSGSDSDSSSGDSESDSEASGSDNSKKSDKPEKKKTNPSVNAVSSSMNNAGNGLSNNDTASPQSKVKQDRKVVRYSDSKASNSNTDDEKGSTTSSSSSSSSSSTSSASSSSESEPEPDKKKKAKKSNITNQSGKGKVSTGAKGKKQTDSKRTESSNVELLLDLDLDGNNADGTGTLAPASTLLGSLGGGVMSPSHGNTKTSDETKSFGSIQRASPAFIPSKSTELLNKIVSGGLQISSRFTRAPHLFSTGMVSIEIAFHNQGKEPIKDIRVGQKTLPTGMSMHDFTAIELLEPEKTTVATQGIDFNDTTQGAKMEILWATEVESKKQTVTIKAPIGELIRPVTMSESLFMAEQGKLRGMNEHEAKTFINAAFMVSSSGMSARQSFVHRVYETANLLQVPSVEDDLVRFAGQSASCQTLVLVTVHLDGPSGLSEGDTTEDDSQSARIVVNCEKMVIGSMLLKELKEALK